MPPTLRLFKLRGLPLQDEELDWIANLTKLHWIDLANTHARASEIFNLAGNPELTELQLSNTDIDDPTLMHLVDHLSIKGISIANANVTSDGVLYLAKHAPLETIFAEDIRWSRKACKALLNMPTLKWAELDSDGVTHNYLMKVGPPSVELHPKLTVLKLPQPHPAGGRVNRPAWTLSRDAT
jgi:hypothetical protein